MKIEIPSLIKGLSYALDAAEKSYFSHSKHVAFLSVLMAKELGFDEQQCEDVFYASILHDIGAGDIYVIANHCIKGKEIVSSIPVNPCVGEYIYYHHEHYDGTGPFGKVGDDIPMTSQLISLSDLFDKSFGMNTVIKKDLFDKINRWIDNNQKFFNPELVIIFKKIISREYFLLEYFEKDFDKTLEKNITLNSIYLDFEGVSSFAVAFSQIIDIRSPYTHKHSMSIADLVDNITKKLEYDDEVCKEMYIAALLHDVGKLAIDAQIIDKPGKLDPEERFEINKHTYYTRWILEKINGFERIVEYASNHHEKLNGNGYPYHFNDERLSDLEQIMAVCDIYQALTEDRSYRRGMDREKAFGIIDDMVLKNELRLSIVEKIKNII
jgi:putative nucleotidyltransferase with HDIG domain